MVSVTRRPAAGLRHFNSFFLKSRGQTKAVLLPQEHRSVDGGKMHLCCDTKHITHDDVGLCSANWRRTAAQTKNEPDATATPPFPTDYFLLIL